MIASNQPESLAQTRRFPAVRFLCCNEKYLCATVLPLLATDKSYGNVCHLWERGSSVDFYQNLDATQRAQSEGGVSRSPEWLIRWTPSLGSIVQGVLHSTTELSLVPGPSEINSTGCTGGGGGFARGEFRGENFAVKKGGEIFPWRNFGVTGASFTTAAGIVFPEQGQARLRTRLCPLMP